MPYCEIPPYNGEPKHRLYYETYGNGPNKIIFNMGLGGTIIQWEQQIQYFQSKGAFEVVIYENRGISLSEDVPGRWTTAKLASDALHLLNFLNWRANVHIVGLSMGGMVAQELCKVGKGRFASLTLISTIAGGLHSLAYFALSLPSGVQLVIRANLASTGRERLKHGLAVMYPSQFLEQEVKHPETGLMTTNFQLYRKILIKRALEEHAKGIAPPALKSVIKQGFAVATHRVTMNDLAEISKSLNGNVLVITGDQDILVHMKNSERLCTGLNAKSVILPGAGHGAFEQCSELVNSEIESLILRSKRKEDSAKL